MFIAKLVVNDVELVLGSENLTRIINLCLPDIPESSELFDALARCPSARVRAVIAARPELSTKVVRKLARDKNYLVIDGLIQNPNASQHIPAGRIQEIIIADDTELLVSIINNIANMPDIDIDEFMPTMAAHHDPAVRLTVAESSDTPHGLLNKLTSDEDPEVSDAARVSLQAYFEDLVEIEGSGE